MQTSTRIVALVVITLLPQQPATGETPAATAQRSEARYRLPIHFDPPPDGSFVDRHSTMQTDLAASEAILI